MRGKLLERFLRYVSFDTQSDPKSSTYPSTTKQLVLLNHLVEEMVNIGIHEVEMDQYGYVTGTIPATEGCEENLPTIGFIAHVDTSPDMSGADVKPQVIEDYDGEDVVLKGAKIAMSVKDFPELRDCKGHTLITTDGTSLLGADDKAGVAEILTAVEYLISNPEIKHGKIRIAFTPDEEIGRGVDHFDVKRFGANFAYTIDGSYEGEFEYENFNGAEAKILIQGRSIHPGYAKEKMVNAIQVACELNEMLPEQERPEHTEGYEGFYHPTEIRGDVNDAEIEYIIRDHSCVKFEEKKQTMLRVVALINERYGVGVATVEIKDQYYNMREMIESHPEIIELAKSAIGKTGLTPVVKPIRGGTDGARLSYMGLPCPNLFTGGANFHGRYEYCSLDVMVLATQTIINIARGPARKYSQ